MKKQIITVVSVALVAILLFGIYSIFLKDDGIEQSTDAFFNLTPDVKEALSKLETGVDIRLFGYEENNSDWEMLSKYAKSIESASRKIDLSTEESDTDFVRVSVDGNQRDLAFDLFFKRLYDGTLYAFDGEALICNAIFELCGMEKMDISLRAVSGYDTEGDTLTASGYPFMFTALDRSNIAFLTINNEHGSYSIYQQDKNFYFSESVLVSYDDEMFSLLTTTCRYPVTVGKMDMPEGKTFANYKLDKQESATCSYSLMTVADKEGRYYLHTVYVGALASTGSFYYARYIGGLFEPGKNGESDKMIQNLSKDKIYFLSASDVQGSLALPSTDIMAATLVYGINDTGEAFAIDNVHIDYHKEEIYAQIRNMVAFNAAPNLAANDNAALTKLLGNKVFASDYSNYDGGWTQHTDVFAGLTSSDGKSTYVQALLSKKSETGDYKMTFGLLRDEKNGAYLPNKVSISVSSDGVNFFEPENYSVIPSHEDGKVKKYDLDFHSDEPAKFVRVKFDVPQSAKTYVVFDEIRFYADGKDAQPPDSISGVWRLMRPDAYIDEGRNFAYLDSNNFNNFLYGFATLTDTKVVACAISENGDPSKLNTEKLAKFGLDKPEKHFSYDYNGITTDLYVSAPNENGNYYVYSVLSGKSGDTEVNFCTDVVCELNTTDCPWLGWKFVEFVDHSLLSMYITEIDEMSISFDGKKYDFTPVFNADDDMTHVEWNGEELDQKSFKYLYQYVLKIYMQDEYVPQEGDNPREYLRINIETESRSTEIVFYRVSASRCYFTIDGQGSYYALVEDVNNVMENTLKYIEGKEVR